MRIFKTVKTRIIALMLCFALAITSLVVTFSYFLIIDYQTSTFAQSTEFNLRLVSQTVERDLVEIFALADWCGNRANLPARYMSASAYDPVLAVNSHTELHAQFQNKQPRNYISRVLVISSEDGTRVLHAGVNSNTSTLSFLEKNSPSPIAHYKIGNKAQVYDIGNDYYSRVNSKCINILGPVVRPGGTDIVGTVYIAISPAVISDRLKGYTLPEGASLYLSLGKEAYLIHNGEFIPAGPMPIINPGKAGTQQSTETLSGTVQMPGGEKMNIVSCSIREGMAISQIYDRKQALPPAGTWLLLMLGVCILILLLALFVIIMLNRTISRPVEAIREKMVEIAAGDFSYDAAIESNSEIGEVGRGINQLSRDIVELMENRITDEQQKRELEYRMLQSQINPHFLYNTLGAIKWMAKLQKAEGIAEMTTALSRLLKTVAKDLRKLVPLQDELALLDDYFLILKYRYGSMIDFNKNIESESLLECYLPRFVLQPLMENAIFHGIEPKGHGKVELIVKQCGEDVCISIIDDGVGLSPEAIKNLEFAVGERAHSGAFAAIGMQSVHQRVRSVFGEGYGLSAESEEGRYTKMTIRIPASIPHGYCENTATEG